MSFLVSLRWLRQGATLRYLWMILFQLDAAAPGKQFLIPTKTAAQGGAIGLRRRRRR